MNGDDGYEFSFYVSRKKYHSAQKHTKTTEYICWAENCPCKREVLETTLTTKKTVEIFEAGEHKQPGEVSCHLPVKRPSFRWDNASKTFMAEYVQNHRDSSPSVVLQELKLKKLDYGATLQQVRNWLKAHKKKKSIKPRNTGDPLRNLKFRLGNITKVENWEGVDMNEPLLFPDHVFLTGDEAEAFSETLGQSKRGKKFALVAVVSTPALCMQLLDQYRTAELSLAADITDDGLVLEKTGFPFYGFDGNNKILHSGTLWPFATSTKNNHGRILAVGMSHNESKATAKPLLKSFETGLAMILKKLEYDNDMIDRLQENIHILSDDAASLKKAVNEHLQQTECGTESSCSAHILTDGFKKNKTKLTNIDNYERFKAHIQRLLKLPRSMYGDIPWRAIKEKWLSLGEKAFCKWFEDEHIDKNFNWRAASAAFGVPDDNNIIESLNEHKFRKMFSAAHRREDDKKRLPITFDRALEILVDELLPSWSDEYPEKGFESDFETTHQERKLAKEYWLDPYLLELTEQLWCARFQGQKTVTVSKQTAKRALRLLKQAFNATQAGPRQEGKISWSWDEFKLVSEMVFTSADSCFPCLDFCRKQICMHLMTVRQQLGLKGLLMGLAADEDEDDVILPRKRGGNKRKRDKPGYHGEVHDRMQISKEHEKKETAKRRRERKDELKSKSRPVESWVCDTCNKELPTAQGLKSHCTLKKHRSRMLQDAGNDDTDDDDSAGDDSDDDGL